MYVMAYFLEKESSEIGDRPEVGMREDESERPKKVHGDEAGGALTTAARRTSLVTCQCVIQC